MRNESESSGEVRVFNESDEIPEWISYGRHTNSLPDVLNGRLEARAGARKMLDRFLGIAHAPVGDRPSRPGFRTFRIGIQPKLEATNVEADIEWLVEVRLDAEGGAIPGLGALEVGNVIDHGT